MPTTKTASKKRGTRVRRQTKRRLTWAAATASGLIVFLAFYLWASSRPGQFVKSLGNEHLQSEDQKHVPYNSVPPTSGPHLPVIARWGVHTEPIVNELQVHNLEEGGVVVQYNCPQGCRELVEKLRAIILRYDTQIILAPYPGMDARIALTAWSRLDKFDDFDEKRIVRFIDAYRGIDHHPRGGILAQ